MPPLKPELWLLRLDHCAILQQLYIEEALLRADQRNICIINSGSPAAIVMGISGKQELLVDSSLHQHNPIPIIRRFSGGGTVVIDPNTLFVTIIANSSELKIAPFPKAIMEWSATLYSPIFPEKAFTLKESDYALGERKCGGNAQYICRGRWLHHTSFLWDWSPALMALLKQPPRMPLWRQERSHSEFIDSLRNWQIATPDQFFKSFTEQLQQHFQLRDFPLDELPQIFQRPHRRTTTLLPAPRQHHLQTHYSTAALI